jgi:hypothetical protein
MRQAQAKGFVILLILTLAACGGGDMFTFGTRGNVQKLLGMNLPEPVEDLRFEKYQPNKSFTNYTAYIRYRTTEAAYLELVTSLGLTYGATFDTPYGFLLPGEWHVSPGLKLDWWTAAIESPATTATGDFGKSGWIVTKYEAGYAFIKLQDPA